MTRRLPLVVACALLLCLVQDQMVAQKREGLALTPPMGWNSWNKFACDVNEALIRQTADAMVSSGMRDAGYRYIVIDDCWQVDRDSLGFIVADPLRFPSGIKALAEYIHSKGLKFGDLLSLRLIVSPGEGPSSPVNTLENKRRGHQSSSVT